MNQSDFESFDLAIIEDFVIEYADPYVEFSVYRYEHRDDNVY